MTPVADPGARPGGPASVACRLRAHSRADRGGRVGLRFLDHYSDTVETVFTCVFALLVAMSVTTRFIVTRQSLGGPEGTAICRAALRSGMIPADAETNRWRRELLRRRSRLVTNRWVAPLCTATFLLVGISAVASAPVGDVWAGWSVVALTVGLGSAATVRITRTLPRVRRLLTELDGGTS